MLSRFLMTSSRSAVAKVLSAIVVILDVVEELFVWDFEFLSMRDRCSKYNNVVNGVTPLSHVYVRLSVHRARTQASSSGHPLCSAHGGTRTWTELPTRRLLMYMCLFVQYLLTACPLRKLSRELNIVHAGQSSCPPPPAAVITVMYATLTINWPSTLR